jgi:hypothetical protein
MSRLNDLINEAILIHTNADGALVPHEAVSAIKPSLDDESRDVLVTEALTSRVTAAAKNSRTAIFKSAKNRNLELPFSDLHGAYPLDLEGRYVKRTESLLRAEMQRVISIREKQIVDDTKHLAELRAAFTAVEPIWDAHPDWTFGQCCNALLRKAAA